MRYSVAYKEWYGSPVVLFWHKDSNEGLLFYIGIDAAKEDSVDYGAIASDNSEYNKKDLRLSPLYHRPYPKSRDEALELARIIEQSFDWRFPDIRATADSYKKWLDNE